MNYYSLVTKLGFPSASPLNCDLSVQSNWDQTIVVRYHSVEAISVSSQLAAELHVNKTSG